MSGWDIGNYYLKTPMWHSKYIMIHIRLVPPDIIAHYKLNELFDEDGWIYMKIIQGMYGLPQAGILSNSQIAHCLHNHRYYQVNRTPGLWQHVWIPISFKLVVDIFGIRYVG